ncbi:Formate--tetrahydrofolate ligase [Calidithermus terrae]|uniref:Formate--tetrahydrofolate ligase n=1 Tax=Calidithermus terrae TaxID=1408545 RepID=A0A399EJ98_9DEIN|nr:Formate--tetrahydrofolate ligase [Calidithermus terrae]
MTTTQPEVPSDLEAARRGLPNLLKHAENVRLHGFEPVLALNRFPDDTPAELALLEAFARQHGLRFARAEVHARGGEGGLELAGAVKEALQTPGTLRFAYELEATLPQKIEAIAARVYGAARVEYTREARKALKQLAKEGCEHLPVVVAKTANSLSDNPRLRGRPEGFGVTVTDLKARCGAGFVVAYMGEVMTMPGLPKTPAAQRIDLDEQGQTVGLS